MANTRVEELAEHLQGSCESIGDEQDDWSEEELTEFDNLVFCCDGCGWWFEAGEAVDTDDGDRCPHCAEDQTSG